MAKIDAQNRSPDVEILPDLRLRVTREYDLTNDVPKTPAELATYATLAWGTPDTTYTNCYLISQRVEGQNDNPATGPNQRPPRLIRVFEQLTTETGETLVGKPEVDYGPDGLAVVVFNYLQLSVAVAGITPTYQVPGTTTAPSPWSSCVLKSDERTDDGTLQRIKRTYSAHGLISQTTDTKYNGQLTILTQTYANSAPSPNPPTGYVQIDLKIDNINGFPVKTYTFALGTGQISTQTEYRLSPDQGTTGVTVTTIKYISTPSVSSNPITGPGGSELISQGFDEQDGYRLWTAVYASGQGTIATTTEYKNENKLVIYSITAINAAPSTPSSTIGGTVTLIKADKRNGTRFEDGTIIYDYQWAEGEGLVVDEYSIKNSGALVTYRRLSFGAAPTAPSAMIGGTVTLVGSTTKQEDGFVSYDYQWAEGIGTFETTVRYEQSADAGTTGVTITTYRALTAIGASNPTSPPSGAVLVEVVKIAQDGYLLWTVTYASGTGTVISSVEQRNGGDLVLYRIVAINTAPSTPSATIGGTVTLVGSESRKDNGYLVYDYKWAEGIGTFETTVRYEQSVDTGTHGVTITTYRALTAIGGSNPTTAPSGSVLIESSSVGQDGYLLWTVTYAKGVGTVISSLEYKYEDKLVLYRIVALGSAPSAPSATIGGTVTATSTESRNENGYVVYDYRWAEGEGLVVDESIVQEYGALVVYHRVSFGVAPSTPSATISGTVTLFEQNIRQQDGYALYDYRWAEGNGQSSITTRGEPDGALIYEVVNRNAASATPSYPGSGTAYLIELTHTPAEGSFINRATYKKPPATTTLRRTVEWTMPGLAFFVGTQLTLQPPVRMTLLASVVVSYATTQDTTAPFSITVPTSFNDTYVPTANPAAPVSRQYALEDYISAGTTGSGTGLYNGVDCASYEYATTESTPSALPSGSTVIHNDNELYLTDVTGTQVFRNSKTSYSF